MVNEDYVSGSLIYVEHVLAAFIELAASEVLAAFEMESQSGQNKMTSEVRKNSRTKAFSKFHQQNTKSVSSLSVSSVTPVGIGPAVFLQFPVPRSQESPSKFRVALELVAKGCSHDVIPNAVPVRSQNVRP